MRSPSSPLGSSATLEPTENRCAQRARTVGERFLLDAQGSQNEIRQGQGNSGRIVVVRCSLATPQQYHPNALTKLLPDKSFAVAL